jgi:hypothetical protein
VSDDRPIRQLAAVTAAIGAAADDPAAFDRLLDTLVGAGGIFSNAILFRGGYGGASFVVASSRGEQNLLSRNWLRWPLRRLFARMKPSRIADPTVPQRVALAIPFGRGIDRWVVVATISESGLRRESADFFAVLENCMVPHTRLSRERLPLAPMNPVITGFALCDDLYKRVEASLRARGWSLERVPTFGQLSRLLQAAVPDIIAIDASELAAPLSAITSVLRIANYGALQVLAFHAEEFAGETHPAVIDRLLPHEADAAAISRAVKELVRESLTLRALNMEEEDELAQRRAAQLISPRELADFGAERAAEILNGWACSFLLDERGVTYRGESRRAAPPAINSIPKGFLSDSCAFEPQVGQEFLDEVTDDPAERIVILATRPVSGASIPLISSTGRHRGVLIAFSTEGAADSNRFQALERLGRILTQRFERLEPAGESIPEFRSERLWQRLRDRMLGLDVYRSADCAIPWHYRIIDETRGLLTFGLEDDSKLARGLTAAGGATLARTLKNCVTEKACFAAAIDFSSQALCYASRGFSPPIVDRRGAVTSIGGSVTLTTGVTLLKSAASATICDGTLWEWLKRRGYGLEMLPTEIDNERPRGLASIVTLG